MSPFYSDRQRRYFFAVIAPMMDFGGNMFVNHIVDPIAEKLGWEKVEQNKQIEKLREGIKDSSYLKLLTEDETGKIKKADMDELIKSKLTDLMVDGFKQAGLSTLITEYEEHFLTKKEREAIVKANFSSEYGIRNEGGKEKWHAGNDIGMLGKKGISAPTPVEGVVVFSGCYNNYGNTVEIIGSDNKIRRFAHLAKSYVKPGDEIKAGELIGEIGNTVGIDKTKGKIHLHYEKRKNYLYHKEGKEVSEITYEDFRTYGPKVIAKLTDNTNTTNFKKYYVDDKKRFDIKTNTDSKHHTQSLDPKSESKQIIEKIIEHEKTKAVVKKLINAYNQGKITDDKPGKQKKSKSTNSHGKPISQKTIEKAGKKKDTGIL